MITYGDRVKGLILGIAYTGTVINVLPGYLADGYYVAFDDPTMPAGTVSPLYQPNTSIELMIPDNRIGLFGESDNDYWWQADHTCPPFDTISYTIQEVQPTMSNGVDMFGAITANTVLVTFLEGQLSVVITGQFDAYQVKAFNTGAMRITGIKACALDTFAPHSEEVTAFILTFMAGIPGRYLLLMPAAIQDYAERFLQDMQPTAKQSSLF